MQRVYLDHAATTPVDQEVVETMNPYFSEKFGNPSSIYSLGREAQKALDRAREQVAQLLNAAPEEIIFTSGGSESDNQAIKAVAFNFSEKGKHIITTEIEHHAVLHTCKYLEKKHGFEVTYLPVDKYGLVDPQRLKDELRDDTILVSIIFANNEIGTIQPVKELALAVENHGAYFHTDAVQAFGTVDIDLDSLPVDLLSLSAHKIYGPKGIGALYVRKGTKISPLVHGGAQERKLRAGTENVPAVVGFGKACELSQRYREERNTKIKTLRKRLLDGIMENIDEVILNGHPQRRLPNNINVCFKYVEGESLLLNLDMVGIAASSGSACTSGSLEASHVLLAVGLSQEVAHGSLRLTLGKDTTEDEIDYTVKELVPIVEKLRDMSPLYSE